MNNKSLIGQILTSLRGLDRELTGTGQGNTVWTMEAKSNICRLGADLGFQVAASGASPNRFGEWLYDICWLDYALGKDGVPLHLKRVRLAAECEWGNPGDVEDDFEKLLAARADIRVMVFESKNESAV